MECYCTVPGSVPLKSDVLVGQQRSEPTEVLHRSKSLDKPFFRAYS
jgi:hypothetical protein